MTYVKIHFNHKGEMVETQAPEPDLFASCPNEGKVLDYYKGQFDSVYVLLSPFHRPKSGSIERFRSEDWSSMKDMADAAEPISWETVRKVSGFGSLHEIDIALRTQIHGLDRKFENKKLAQTLVKKTDKNGIISPYEGDISPFIEDRLYEALQSIGEQWLWVGDEFCQSRELFVIDELKRVENIPPHGCVFTPDKKILVTTHWDSHFSFLCSSKSTIEKILQFENFEGFFCTPETEVYWSLH